MYLPLAARHVGRAAQFEVPQMQHTDQVLRQYPRPGLAAVAGTLPDLSSTDLAALPGGRTAHRGAVPHLLREVWINLGGKCCVLGFLLLGLIFTDAETKLLPDKLTLPGLALGFVFSLIVPVNDLASQLLPGVISVPSSSEISWRVFSLLDACLGAAVGASFIYGAGAIYLHWRGVEGMGFGDVKLMAMIGSFLGIRLTILTLFAATLTGSIFGLGTVVVVWIKRMRRRMVRHHETVAIARRRAWESARMVYRYYQIPFGVFLGSMALVAFFFGNQFLHWYWGVM